MGHFARRPAFPETLRRKETVIAAAVPLITITPALGAGANVKCLDVTPFFIFSGLGLKLEVNDTRNRKYQPD
jgi:hypothetical protein